MEVIKFDDGNLLEKTIKIEKTGDITEVGTALLSGQYLDGDMESFQVYVISAAY